MATPFFKEIKYMYRIIRNNVRNYVQASSGNLKFNFFNPSPLLVELSHNRKWAVRFLQRVFKNSGKKILKKHPHILQIQFCSNYNLRGRLVIMKLNIYIGINRENPLKKSPVQNSFRPHYFVQIKIMVWQSHIGG